MDKIRKNFNLTRAEVKALQTLREKGYALPSDTATGVIRQAIRDAWESFFQGQPFPLEGELEQKGK
jgi:hypothetical protein